MNIFTDELPAFNRSSILWVTSSSEKGYVSSSDGGFWFFLLEFLIKQKKKL
jgi:hypothetical protein